VPAGTVTVWSSIVRVISSLIFFTQSFRWIAVN
jgi:hypothetical protein